MSIETYQQMIVDEANKQGVDPSLALAMADQESSFNPKAQSNKGAAGLMGLMPDTAVEMGITPADRFIPEKNVKAGVGYIKKMMDLSKGDLDGALARYNFGLGNVAKGRELPPETIDYQQKIKSKMSDKYSQYAMNDTQKPASDVSPWVGLVGKQLKDKPAESAAPSKWVDMVGEQLKNKPQDVVQQPTETTQPQDMSQSPIIAGVGDVAGTVVHDVGAPIVGYLGGLGAGLTAQMQGKSPEEAAQAAQEVKAQTEGALEYNPSTAAGNIARKGLGLVSDVAGYVGKQIAAPVVQFGDRLTGSTPEEAAQHAQHIRDVGVGQALQEDVSKSANPMAGYAAGMLPAMAAAEVGAKMPIPNVKASTAAQMESVTKPGGLASKVAQGLEDQIQKQVEVSKQLTPEDISKSKTYLDYANVLDGKVKPLARTQDKLYASYQEKHPLATLSRGDPDAPINYVAEGISQMKDYYSKTNDSKGLGEMVRLEKKAVNEGLTAQEINDLARKHNTDLSNYNDVTGQLANGMTAAEVENVRMGMKQTARDLTGNDPRIIEIDKAMSPLLDMRRQAKANAKLSYNVQKKLNETGLIGKLSSGAGVALDTMLGHSPSAFLRGLSRMGGDESLNTFKIQKELNANLTKINDILNDNTMSGRLKQAAIETLLTSPKAAIIQKGNEQ